jgi:hypothetical protein
LHEPVPNVYFRNVTGFLDYLPADELKIVERLRELIFYCIPDAKEKLAYNIPFYYRQRPDLLYMAGRRALGQTETRVWVYAGPVYYPIRLI